MTKIKISYILIKFDYDFSNIDIIIYNIILKINIYKYILPF